MESGGHREIDAETMTLQVFNTTVEDAGFYTCLAWNQVGTDQHTVLVQVNTDSTSESSSALGSH